MAYRADIDGLRALAVTLVVLFHAQLGIFGGGFIGVDVFFVISGYLIASIIAHDVAEGKFSVAQFYARRARRILPALFVILIASTIAALFLLILPQDLEAFARSARATLLFYSNFFFSRSGDYFNPALETLPLLHTWSLGVEEQFYLVAPLLLAPLMGSTRKRSWAIFAAAFTFFLLLSQYGVLREGAKAFFWPHTRAFELMIGVAIASPLLKPLGQKTRALASAAGMIMILLAATMYTPQTAFPGFAALLPTVGAALLIWSGLSADTFVSRILSSPPAVFMGKISYPLYLWHWPIFVFAGLMPLTRIASPMDRIGLIALAVACATATYFFLEVPIRRKVGINIAQRPFVLGGAVVAIIVWLMPLEALIWSGGWSERFGPEVARFTRENPTILTTPGLCGEADKWWSGSTTDCVIGDTNVSAATFVLWGDSHGRVLAPAISAIAKARGLKGYFVARGGCEPLSISLGSADWPIKCLKATERVFQLLADPEIDRIIIAGRWAAYNVPAANSKDAADLVRVGIPFGEALSTTVERLTAGNRQLTIVGPVPEPLFNVPLTMTRALIRGQSDAISITRANFEQRNDEVLKALAQAGQHSGVRLLYPHLAFCDALRCLASDRGNALYVDDNHLSPRGVARLDGLLSTIFDDSPALAQESGMQP